MTAAPVQLGDTVYEARAWSYADKLVPCPVCYGKLFAILELGNGERVTVECEACGVGFDGPRGVGFDGPRGVINMLEPGSQVLAFEVTGLLQKGDEWEVFGSQHYARKWGIEVFATEALAEAKRAILYADAVQEAAFRGMRRSEYLRKKPTWLVRYHREQIRNAERDLAWHTRKLSDALARKRNPEGGGRR